MILSFLTLDFMSESLFSELFTGPLVLFSFGFTFHMTHDDSLYLKTGIPIVCRQPRPSILRLYLLREGGLCVTEVEFVGVGSSVHHELLRLIVVCFGDDIRDNVRVLRQQRFVVDLLPLELLAKLRVAVLGLGHRAHTGEAEVLKM